MKLFFFALSITGSTLAASLCECTIRTATEIEYSNVKCPVATDLDCSGNVYGNKMYLRCESETGEAFDSVHYLKAEPYEKLAYCQVR